MNQKQTSRWFLDAALFLGFIAAFMLDVTGTDLHQWIGTAAGALAAYHLAAHWKWVTNVSRRFFVGVPSRSRLNYALDALLLAGFVTIGITGLVISTWLNLKLGAYDAWLTAHILASMVALVVLIVKVGLHWRWVVSVSGEAAAIVFGGRAAPVLRPSVVEARAPARRMGRRDFLQMMGVVGIAAVVAGGRAADGLLIPASAEAASPATSVQSASTGVTARAATTSRSSSTASQSGTGTQSCTVRCNKACSYPGRCRKYVDGNRNGRCDLGECL